MMRQSIKIFTSDLLDSTNRHAGRLAKAGERLPFAVLADGQTCGKGRRGRRFYSPSGSGFYFTYATKMRSLTPGQITCLAAAASASAVSEIYGVELSIKWINDLYLNGKKVAGILTENIDQVLIIGVGINIWGTSFPDELKEKATSLFTQEPAHDRRIELARLLSQKLETMLDRPIDESLSFYRARLIRGQVRFLADSSLDFREGATIIDIDRRGHLIVEIDRQRHLLCDE